MERDSCIVREHNDGKTITLLSYASSLDAWLGVLFMQGTGRPLKSEGSYEANISATARRGGPLSSPNCKRYALRYFIKYGDSTFPSIMYVAWLPYLVYIHRRPMVSN